MIGTIGCPSASKTRPFSSMRSARLAISTRRQQFSQTTIGDQVIEIVEIILRLTDCTPRSQQNAPDRICEDSTMWTIAVHRRAWPKTSSAALLMTAEPVADPSSDQFFRYHGGRMRLTA